MAASAAKYGHCLLRYPVPYRPKAPLRAEIAAPLDFAVRSTEILGLDRELDRSILRPDDHAELWIDSVRTAAGPGGVFLSEEAPPRSGRERGGPLRRLGPRRRRAIVNGLRLAGDATRFRAPWTEGTVRELHELLLSGLGLPDELGQFRTSPMRERDRSGRTIFEACPPERIRSELAGLLDWVDRRGTTLFPVIPAAVVLQGLYAIRPFPNGNGTIARALAGLYLRSFGLPNFELAPWPTPTPFDLDLRPRLVLYAETTGSYTEWVDHLTDLTLTGYYRAVTRWLGPHRAAEGLEEVALRLIVRARRHPGWFSSQQAAGWVGGRRGTTVSRHLNELVRRGILESLGKTRAKRYRWVPPNRVLDQLTARLGGTPVAEAALPPTGIRPRTPAFWERRDP